MSSSGRCLLAALVVVFFLSTVCSAGAQQAQAVAASTQVRYRCLSAANPHRRTHECNDEDLLKDETLEEGWAGVRRAAKRIGITPTASYTGSLQSNAMGGSHRVWTYDGQLSFSADADLGEMLHIPGLSAYVGASWGTGGNLAASLNSTIPTTGLYAPSFYLGEMYLQEKVPRSRITVLAGRLAAGNAFASLPVFNSYVSYAINPNPYSLVANDETFSGPPPGAQWGAQIVCAVRSEIQITAGVFNTNLNAADGGNHGADFSLQEGNKGALAVAEIDYLRNQKSTSTGKPGQITFGVLHSNDERAALDGSLQRSSGYSGVYAMAQQMVYRRGGSDSSHGATVWGSWTFNSDERTSPIRMGWGFGLTYQGIIPSRSSDVVSLGFVRHDGSRYGSSSNDAMQMELNYQWVHSRYLTMAPHMQYLRQDTPRPYREGVVLGIQLALIL